MDVLKYLSEKVLNPESALKWISYSAHDTNLALFLRVLNITSSECLYEALSTNYNGTCSRAP